MSLRERGRGGDDAADGVHVVAYSDATELGGAEQSLANLLASLAPRIRVTVVGNDREIVEWLAGHRPGSESCFVAPVRNKRDLRAIVAHYRVLRRLRPDILHANLRIPTACQYALFVGLMLRGIRVVAVEQLPVPPTNRLQRRLKQATSRRLAAHVAVGDRAATMVEGMYGLRPGSLRTIHNGVPDVPLPPPMEDTRAGPRVGSLARLTSQKGFDVLLRALALLPDVTAVLVGDGPDRKSLEQLAEQLGLRDRLEVTGWLSDPRPLLSTLEVFVLPSRYEGFPLSVVEAMLAALPVVASDVGSVREAVIHRETGLLVPPEDVDALVGALGELLADEALRRRLGERGRALALERFSAGAMADAFESLYDEITAPAPRRRAVLAA